MRLHPRIRTGRVAAAGFALALILAATSAPGQSSSGTPAPLTRYVPRDNLLFYLEFAGLDSQPDAWRKTAACKILNDTTAGAMLEELFVQLVGKIPNSRITGPDALALLKHAARSGFVFAAGRPPGGTPSGYAVLVLRDAYKNKDIRPIAVRAIQGLMMAPTTKLQSTMRVGHKIVSGVNLGNGTTSFWVDDSKKEDLVVVSATPESPDFVLETLDGKRPNAAEHPRVADLYKPEAGFVPLTFAFVDESAFKSPLLASIGLDDLTRLDYRWGFADDALMAITRVSSKGPRKGVLALLDGPSFEKGSPPPIPESVTDYTIAAFDLKATADKVVGLARSFQPDIETRWNRLAETIKAKTKLRLREDILGRLGPRAAWYVLPAKAGAPATLAAPSMASMMMASMGIDQIPKAAIIIDVDDSAAFGKALDELMAYANRELKAQMAPKAAPGDATARNRRGPAGPTLDFRLMPGENKTYVLGVPPELASMVPASVRPTIRLGPKQVVIAISPDVARAALEAKGGGSPPTALAAAFAGLPSKLKMLSVADPRDTTPAALAALPGKLQAGINAVILQATRTPEALAAAAAAPAPPANRPPSPMSMAMGGGGGGSPNPGGMPMGGSPNPGGMPMGGGGGGAAKPPEGNGTIVLQVDAAKLPSADAIKALLFPSIFAVEVNDEGLRIITREAFPAIPDVSKAGSLASAYEAAALRLRAAGIPLPASMPAPATPPPGAVAPPPAPPAGRETLPPAGGPRGRGRGPGPRLMERAVRPTLQVGASPPARHAATPAAGGTSAAARPRRAGFRPAGTGRRHRPRNKDRSQCRWNSSTRSPRSSRTSPAGWPRSARRWPTRRSTSRPSASWTPAAGASSGSCPRTWRRPAGS